MRHLRTSLLSFLFVATCTLPFKVLAAFIEDPGSVSSTGGKRPTQLAGASLNDSLNLIWDKIGIYVGFLGSLALIFIIVNGIKYLLSSGDAKKTGEAKQAIIQLVLAVAMLVGSSAIVSVIWAVARALGS